MKTGILASMPLLMAAATTGTTAASTTETKRKREKDPRPNSLVKSERSVNSIINACERLERKGKGITAAQQKACLDAIKGAVAHVEQVFAGKASAKAGFSLGDGAESK